MNEYQERDDNLLRLGFSSYEAYLASNLWYQIRDSVLLAAGRVCACCGGAATQVHHRSYSLAVLKGDITVSLVPICHNCHRKAEFSENGKRSFAQANQIINAMVEKCRRAPVVHGKRDPSRCPCGNMRKKNRGMCKRCKDMPQRERLKLWRKLFEESVALAAARP